jgi:hypothetical protein
MEREPLDLLESFFAQVDVCGAVDLSSDDSDFVGDGEVQWV